MKVLKRNQLIILVISLMLITAGYLNFASNTKEADTNTVIGDRDDTSIGDAQFVSTIPEENEKEKVENLLSNEININKNEDLEETTSDVLNTTETTNNTGEKQDYYFTTSRLDRNMMYSQLLETYQEMYNNINATAEQKNEALAKINEINNTKNAIMIAENLIIAKNFEDVVIFVNDDSISVIVKTKELRDEQVAQIQNIVSRELKSRCRENTY